MPRDGSGIYTRPPGTNAVPDTTIESTKYNNFVGDVETDLNAPRPIVAGGTGASSAGVARTNLKAEVAGQQVTNYDTHTWENGSFWSAGTATAAPTAGAGYVGVCTIYDVGTSFNFIAIEARNVSETPVGTLYVRMKSSGVWSNWVAQPANPSADFVNVTGDTMTGDLGIDKANPTLVLKTTADMQAATVYGSAGATARWAVTLGDATSNTGGNAGSNFGVARFNDAGAFIESPMTINRATGIATFTQQLISPKGVDNGWGPVRFAQIGGGFIGWDVNNSGIFPGIWDRSNSPGAGSANGYQKFGSGIIMQWGFIGSMTGDITVSLPLTFPVASLAAIATIKADVAAANAVVAANVVDITTSQIRIQGRYVLNGGTVGGATQGLHWFAVGY